MHNGKPYAPLTKKSEPGKPDYLAYLLFPTPTSAIVFCITVCAIILSVVGAVSSLNV